MLEYYWREQDLQELGLEEEDLLGEEMADQPLPLPPLTIPASGEVARKPRFIRRGRRTMEDPLEKWVCFEKTKQKNNNRMRLDWIVFG